MHLGTNAAGWPVGYSKFIKYFGYLSHSANVLVAFQYLITQLGFLLFFLSFRQFFLPGKVISLITFVFLFINPINIFGSNHILSDPLYIGISMIWVTQLLWIIFAFKPYMVITQALLLLLLFDLRYNALYFPILTTLAFLTARLKTQWKIAGISFTILLLGAFYQYTCLQMEKTVGVKQYAYSNGWKQASNSLYIYEHYYKSENLAIPDKFHELDSMVRNYFDHPHPDVSLYYPDQEITLGSFYMAVGGTPLVKYMQLKSGFTEWSLDFHKTAPYGPLYKSYGNYLILHHPIGYLQYVVAPHIKSYLSPYPEIFSLNPPAFELWMDNDHGKVARDWFNLTTLNVPDTYILTRSQILSFYPIIYNILHLVFILTLLSFIVLKGFISQKGPHFWALIILTTMCLGNFLFTVLSTTSVLRYQPAVIALELTLILYFIEHILKLDSKQA